MPFHLPLLVADAAEGFVAVQEALAGRHALLHAQTFPAAVAAVDRGPALVVCGYDFDEGRMYDLLVHAKSQVRPMPFLAIRAVSGERLLEDSAYESVKIAVTALGGDGFIDLAWWRGQWGEKQASLKLAQVVDQLIAAAAPRAGD